MIATNFMTIYLSQDVLQMIPALLLLVIGAVGMFMIIRKEPNE